MKTVTKLNKFILSCLSFAFYFLLQELDSKWNMRNQNTAEPMITSMTCSTSFLPERKLSLVLTFVIVLYVNGLYDILSSSIQPRIEA